ncbi:MAG TPA: DMT family transporter [Aestuariivirga sp.]|nr:DMT family transporter [Aestuariivirga sp.]
MSPPQHQTLRAGLYMVITTACFVGGDTCIKLIGTTLPLGEIICLVGLLSTIFLSLICAQQGVLNSSPMIFTRTVLLRSLFDVLGSFMFVSALMHMPLANLSAVMQSVPLVVVVVAVAFLGEKAGVARSSAVIIGFVGVLLIVKPSPQAITIYEFLAVGAVVVVALRDLVTKRIPAHVPLLIIALANAVFVSLSGFGFGLAQGFKEVEAWQLASLAGAGLFVTCGYFFIVATVRLGELSATAPFRYAEVVFAIIAGIMVFNEFPDLLSYIGMALVIAAGLYAAHREAAQTRDAKAELMPPAF